MPLFICERCKKLVPPNTPQHRLIVETRLVHHPRREEVHVHIQPDGKRKLVEDPGGDGTQITRELLICPQCAQEMQQQ